MNATVLNTALLVLTTAGCTTRTPTVSSQAHPPQVEPIASNPVLIELVSRDYTVIVKGGRTNLLYSIESGGKIVAHDLSTRELHTLHPLIYHRLKGSYSQGGSFDWAGLNVESLRVSD
jgi:hypothetical protein